MKNVLSFKRDVEPMAKDAKMILNYVQIIKELKLNVTNLQVPFLIVLRDNNVIISLVLLLILIALKKPVI